MVFRRNYARYGAETTFFASIDEFVKHNVPTDVISISYGSALLDLRIIDKNSDTTIVMFHAASNPLSISLPLFVGNNLVEGIEINTVFVSDPALDYGAPIGWFAGTRDLNVQGDIETVLKHIVSDRFSNTNLIFFGGSAGGFAALYYSHLFVDSLAIVSNPQTNIEKYFKEGVKRYEDVCWNGEPVNKSGITFDLVSLYKKSCPNFILYLQNQDDALHLNEHCRPWAHACERAANHWKILVGDWGDGHAPAPFFLLSAIVNQAATLNGDWQQLLRDPELDDFA